MPFKSHARFSNHLSLAAPACQTGGVVKVLAKTPAPKTGKNARISGRCFMRSAFRSLSDDNRSSPENTGCFFLNSVASDHGSNETSAKLSLEGKPYLFLFYDVAIQDVSKESPAVRPCLRPCDGDVKLVLEILDNRVRLPLNKDTQSVTLHNPADRARLFDRRPPKIASSKETAPPVRPSVKRSQLTAYPTLA